MTDSRLPHYDLESYWDQVASQIKKRSAHQLIAGDDEPYYRYKRKKFLQLLHSIDFTNKKVIEIGCGPGGNLVEVYKHAPQELWGVDISVEMLSVAEQTTSGLPVKLQKIDGRSIPADGGYFDIVFTSTVLQHVTDESILNKLIGEICRITKGSVYIFERIEKTEKRIYSNTGRTVKQYQELFSNHGFELQKVSYLDIFWSYAASGVIRKIFDKSGRKEGEEQSRLVRLLQKMVLPLSRGLDFLIRRKSDLGILVFRRIGTYT